MSSRSPVKVYVDAMLGDVAKWLRFFGVPVVYYAEGPDEGLVDLPLFFSSDRELCRRAKGCVVLEGKREEKVAKALCVLGLPPKPRGMFCMECASPLEGVESGKVPVPEGVKAHHKRVYFCRHCGKYYWKGSHWKNIEAFLERVERAYRRFCRGAGKG